MLILITGYIGVGNYVESGNIFNNAIYYIKVSKLNETIFMTSKLITYFFDFSGIGITIIKKEKVILCF
jgi:hypothetical protein